MFLDPHKDIEKHKGYLPHLDYGGALQAITFRLADSLPGNVVEKWRSEIHSLEQEHPKELARRIAHYEDAGHGSCHLRDPEVASIVQDGLIGGHEGQYRLIAWGIMPNHFHVLIRQARHASLRKIVRSWKGNTARLINIHLNRKGTLWAKAHFDRAIRDQDHFWNPIFYIHHNPVRAKLVKAPEDWPFSSQGHNWPLPNL